MTENELRQKYIKAAQSYLGCKESDGSHRKIIDLYNSHRPLARGYAMKYTDAWCACFVSAMAIKCGLTKIIPLEVGCGKMIALAKSMGIWVENDAYRPEPGDIIMYVWNDSGKGDCTGNPDHVGIVVSVSGNTIKIIEGNISNAVGYRNVPIGGRCIRGFITPKFGVQATSNMPSSVSQLVAKGVINSPAYWAEHIDDLKHLGTLLDVLAAKIGDKVVSDITSVNQAVQRLSEAGVIASPDYWMSNHHKVEYLDLLLIKAAKRVATNPIKKGSKVKVKKGAKTYTGGGLASFVYKNTYTVLEPPKGDRAVIGVNGVVTAAVNVKDLILV